MTDQTIPADFADKVRKLAARFRQEMEPHTPVGECAVWECAAEAVETLLPPRPTLADMTLDEQDECTGMQADLAQGDRVVILDGTPDAAGLVQVLEKSLDVYRAYPKEVTPRPDLPRLEWPGDKKPDPAPAPALPDGWRLADHEDDGRVIVTNPTPARDGRVHFVIPSADPMGFDWLFCDHSELTYIDQEADQ